MIDGVRVPEAYAALFAKAAKLVSEYFSDRRDSLDDGTIAVANQRYVLVRAGAFSVEFFAILEKLYPDDELGQAHAAAASLLFDLSHSMGFTDAQTFYRQYKLSDPREKIAAGPLHFARMGWATVTIGAESNLVPGSDYLAVFEHHASFEADAWIAAGRQVPGPVCIMSSGYSSGWCAASMEIDLVTTELTCRARGHDACRFVMAPPDQMQRRIDEYLQQHPDLVESSRGYVIPGLFAGFEAERLRKNMLHETVQLNKGIVGALPGGLVHVRADGAILQANTEACRILGLAYDELSQKYTSDFATTTIFEDGSECSLEDYPVTKALVTGKPQPPSTIGVRRPGGDVAWAVFTAVPILAADGSVSSAVVTFLDITERKRAEQERQEFEQHLWQTQKLESLGVLAGGIAHDFNNLLTGVRANVGLAQKMLENGESAVSLLEEIDLAAARAAELTQKMLAYAGRGSVEVRVIDLTALVSEILHLLKASLPKNVSYILQSAEKPPLVEGDAVQLRQVVMNLISNAAESIVGEEGAVTITTATVSLDAERLRAIKAPQTANPGEFVCLTVEDTGAGMSDAVQRRMFDPFFTTKFSGRGLGLAAVLGIVGAHRGFVEFDSVLGRGTKARVYLPVTASPLPAASTNQVIEPAIGILNGKRCLVVDDDPAVLRVVGASLRRMGADVVSAADGAEGLELFEQSNAFDLVVLDWTMPKISGADVLAAIVAIRPQTRLLVMSGYHDRVRSSLPEANVRFLAKPFTFEQLRLEIAQLLGQ